jgi:hypoxanthine phosphoribosyltransferase
VKQLLSQEELNRGVARLAEEITDCYGQEPLTIVGVLTGSIVLLADLIRLLNMPLRLGLVQASSYRGETTEPGELKIHAEMLPEIADRHVLVVDDIFDTGYTLREMLLQVIRLHPRSIRSAVLLSKEGRCQVDIRPDFVGFDIPDQFVIGYGLDYNDLYRNLPYLAVLESQDLPQEESHA